MSLRRAVPAYHGTFIVLPDGMQGNSAPRATIDNTMVKVIALAFRWQAMLENGT